MIKIIEDNDTYNLERRVNDFVHGENIQVQNMDYQAVPTIKSIESSHRSKPYILKTDIVYSVMIEYILV